MKLYIFLSLLLVSYKPVFSSDSAWIKKPSFGLLIPADKIVADVHFALSNELPETIEPSVRRALVQARPTDLASLETASHEQLVDGLARSVITAVQLEATVFQDDFFGGTYRQKTYKEANEKGELVSRIKIKPIDLVVGSNIGRSKTYLVRPGEDKYFEAEDELLLNTDDFPILYDADKVSEAMKRELGLVRDALALTSKAAAKPITGMSRHIFPACTVLHPYHKTCAVRTATDFGRCAVCSTPVASSTMEYKPEYVKGEECSACLDEIKPAVRAVVHGGGAGSGRQQKKRGREELA